MNRRFHVLIVEDNEADAFLTCETLDSGPFAIDVAIVRDGEEACDYLGRRPPHEQAWRPDLVLLDLNLPRLDGAGVLAAMRAQPDLKRIPVVILTTSDAENDVKRSYELGANCYVTKPVGLEAFRAMIRSLERFWFETVKLP